MTRLLVAALLLVPSLAAADRVTVKGAVLEGKVKSISSKQIVMETIYGKGDLTIKTADVSAIETDAHFHVYKADDGGHVGRVVGITPAAVTIAQADGAPTEIPFDQVQAAPARRRAGRQLVRAPRRREPVVEQQLRLRPERDRVDDRLDRLALGIGATRERGPDAAEARRQLPAQHDAERPLAATTTSSRRRTRARDGSEHITLDELRGFARLEHDLTERVFGFGSLEAEHDGVEALSYRLIPKLGAGYKLVNTETAYLAVDAGFAYVYERFYDDSLNNYVAIAFGGGAQVEAALARDRLVLARRLPAFDHGSDRTTTGCAARPACSSRCWSSSPSRHR